LPPPSLPKKVDLKKKKKKKKKRGGRREGLKTLRPLGPPFIAKGDAL
jgi:hypothetical protein